MKSLHFWAQHVIENVLTHCKMKISFPVTKICEIIFMYDHTYLCILTFTFYSKWWNTLYFIWQRLTSKGSPKWLNQIKWSWSMSVTILSWKKLENFRGVIVFPVSCCCCFWNGVVIFEFAFVNFFQNEQPFKQRLTLTRNRVHVGLITDS